MTISDKLSLLEQTKETQRVKLGLPERLPFNRYHEFFERIFHISDLFANGEQGVWFDPSDLSTMFQDVAGTEPVTKDGDPVAIIKDKSGNGNHAIQSTASRRPIYRSGDGRGTVNLVLNSDKQAGTSWGGGRSVEYDTSDIPPPPELQTVNKVTATVGGSGMSSQLIPVEAGKSYTVSLWVANPKGSETVIRFRMGGPDGTYTTPITENIDGRFCRVSATFNCLTSGEAYFGIEGIRSHYEHPYVYYGGLQVEEGTEVTEYQRNKDHLGGVGTGLPTDLHWLEFDGVDDTMVATISMPQPYTRAVVARVTSEGDNRIYGSTNTQLWRVKDGRIVSYAGRAFYSSNNEDVGTDFYNIEFVKGSDSFQNLNGTVTYGNTGSLSMTSLFLFSRSNDLHGKGRLYSSILINKGLSNNDMLSLEQYLANRAGVTL